MRTFLRQITILRIQSTAVWCWYIVLGMMTSRNIFSHLVWCLTANVWFAEHNSLWERYVGEYKSNKQKSEGTVLVVLDINYWVVGNCFPQFMLLTFKHFRIKISRKPDIKTDIEFFWSNTFESELCSKSVKAQLERVRCYKNDATLNVLAESNSTENSSPGVA